MRRIVILALAAVLLTGSPVAAAFSKPSPSPAVSSSFYFNSSWGGWIDDRCGGPLQSFVAYLYLDPQYLGAKTKLCGAMSTFCDVPLIDAGPCSFGNSANDNVSSIKVTKLYGSNTCIYSYVDADFGGTHYEVGPGSVPNGGSVADLPNGIDDRLSSVKPVTYLLPAC